MQNKRPHIIYILSDEHRGQAMSHAGDPNVRTPAMDALAQAGASFSRAYANCPICTPSRGTIFSGRHAHSGPVQGFYDVYKSTAPSTATLLKEAGYHTAYFGKWHCGVVQDQKPPQVRDNPADYHRWSQPQRTPEHLRAGFDDWFGFELNNKPFGSFYYHRDELNPRRMAKYQTDALTDMAIEYLQEYSGDAPLFLVLSVEPPHFPLEVPDEFERFDAATLQVRPNFHDTPEMRRQLATYYAMIENLDANIARLGATLQQSARFDDTLTVYFSDHGDYMGSHGLSIGKEHPHEESVCIPAIFHWPGVLPPQGRIEGLFSLVDLLPTTLGLLGLPIPPHLQGCDFSPALRGEELTGPREVLLEMIGNPRYHLGLLDWRGLVSGRWKYAFYETGDEMLYDLENDPYEQRNLAAENEEQCRALRERLLALLARAREPYFDVLMQHGAPMASSIHDVSLRRQHFVAPGMTERAIRPSEET